MFVPKSILLWIFVSNIIVCFDAFFVLNRPDTLKGGKYYNIFKLYENYYQYDTLYNMNNDSFVIIQSWLNIAEAVISFVAVFLILAFFVILISIAALILNSDLQQAVTYTTCNTQNIVYETYNGNNNQSMPWSGTNNFQNNI